MGPKPLNISDPESDIEKARPGRPGRPAVSPERMLAAADALFADSGAPQTVTMDAIAAAAGVGKGTLFRAFGSRDGLLDALFATKISGLGYVAAAAGLSPREQAVAFLDTVLMFKLDNRHLLRARELSPTILQSDQYKWMHGTLRRLIMDAAVHGAAERASYAAHALLASLHIDLVEAMLAGGLPVQAIRQAQAAHVAAVIDGF